MKNRLAIAAVMTAACGFGIALAPAQDNSANSPATQPSDQSLSTTGQTLKAPLNSQVVSADDRQTQIRVVFVDVTNAALAKNTLDRLVTYFPSTVQDRFAAVNAGSDPTVQGINSRIDQLSSEWRQKYGHDFNVGDANQVLGDSFATFSIGTIGENPQLAADIRHAYRDNADAQANARAAAYPQNANDADSNQQAQNSRNTDQAASAGWLPPDRYVALADIAASGRLAELRVPLMLERDNQWKILIPDSLTTDRLRHNLLHELTAICRHNADWPADENQAYRQVTRKVLKAVMDVTPERDPQASAQ
jgi:hypothetical protein